MITVNFFKKIRYKHEREDQLTVRGYEIFAKYFFNSLKWTIFLHL